MKTTRPLIKIGWKQTSWKGTPDPLLKIQKPALAERIAVNARKVS